MAMLAITCWDSVTNETSTFVQPVDNQPSTVAELLNHYADASGEPACSLAVWQVESTFEAGIPGTSGWTVVIVQRDIGSGDLCTLAFITY